LKDFGTLGCVKAFIEAEIPLSVVFNVKELSLALDDLPESDGVQRATLNSSVSPLAEALRATSGEKGCVWKNLAVRDISLATGGGMAWFDVIAKACYNLVAKMSDYTAMVNQLRLINILDAQMDTFTRDLKSYVRTIGDIPESKTHHIELLMSSILEQVTCEVTQESLSEDEVTANMLSAYFDERMSFLLSTSANASNEATEKVIRT
jgi:hypothetical protein